MNPFEEFLRRLFGGGPPPTAMEEERQAANMGQAARDLPGMARSIGKSFLDAYKQRAVDLQDLAMQNSIAGGNIPLSDMGGQADPRLAQAQRDLALDVLSAGAFGGASQMGGALLSSAPGVGKYTSMRSLVDAVPEWLRLPYESEKAALNEQLQRQFIRGGRSPFEGIAQRRDIFHSSAGLFPQAELNLSRQGQGIGDYWQGTGAAYVSELPQVRDFYRKRIVENTMEKDFGFELPSGRIIADPKRALQRKKSALKDELEEILFLESRGRGTPKTEETKARLMRAMDAIDQRFLYSDILNARPIYPWIAGPNDLKDIQNSVIKNMNKLENPTYDAKQKKEIRKELKRELEDYARLKNLFDPNAIRRAEFPHVASYSGTFHANPDELFNLNIPVDQQPSGPRIIAALNELPAGISERNYVLSGEGLGDAIVRHQRDYIPTPNVGATNVNEMIVSGQRDAGWSDYRPAFTSATPWETMEALRDKGIVGNQYLTRRDFENLLAGRPPRNLSYNYVVTDPERLRFASVFGAADPFGSLSTTMQAMRNEKEKKKK
jgi:hypothetical protein